MTRRKNNVFEHQKMTLKKKTAKNGISTPHEGAAGNGTAELNHC
jgi:hypothetical protein